MTSPRKHHLAAALDRNITTLLEIQRQIERNTSRQSRVADRITAFTGSIPFVYAHMLWFGGWIVINLGWTTIPPFDPFPFGLLTMTVSLEAIFLSTFVLISQQRLASLSEQRSDLDLQVNLLTEYELTKILRLTDAIADHLKLKEGRDHELDELKKDIHPAEILQEIERKRRELGI